MKYQIRRILSLTLIVILLYFFGVFNEISFFSLLVIVPVCITYIILTVRIINLARNRHDSDGAARSGDESV
jgi:Ca2+/Na+ antiporter